MKDNLNTLTDFQPMNYVELKKCKNTADLINKSDIIPCTGCDYCADCPKGVKISTIFSVYNRYKNGELSLNESWEEYRKIEVNANACVSCGKCKSHCPQSIDIPKMLSKIKELYS
ncbi:4Fe-4S dicluster domain-containing protein [uncultured Eubacterium sp.]|uniref:4Fe-4S dicluster domain-containing protein n=1 Tax=uncultured Eubacterium sp. TaxID=165185 RepID=UPI0025F05144|nr:4Fe-4S dicluster domain-containing protein [uncultured Eubacterium sp.]